MVEDYGCNIMIWFTSDLHIGHDNIRKLANRPFSSVDEMNETIVDNINKLVKPTDILYNLGDVTWFHRKEEIEPWLKRINCKNHYLIKGNHDWRELYGGCSSYFKGIYDLHEITLNKRKIVMCHYELATWNKQLHGSVSLFGHSHSNVFHRNDDGRKFCLCVEATGYQPVSIDQILESSLRIPTPMEMSLDNGTR